MEFIRFKLIFFTKLTNLLFDPAFGGHRGNLRISSIAHWKARDGRLLFAIIELFSQALAVETL